MAYQIDPRRVMGVIVESNKALQGNGFNHGEVVLGLSELIGRVVVEAAATKIQADELIDAAIKHLKLTVQTGADAREKRIITGV